jgi:hypothetical protein
MIYATVLGQYPLSSGAIMRALVLFYILLFSISLQAADCLKEISAKSINNYKLSGIGGVVYFDFDKIVDTGIPMAEDDDFSGPGLCFIVPKILGTSLIEAVYNNVNLRGSPSYFVKSKGKIAFTRFQMPNGSPFCNRAIEQAKSKAERAQTVTAVGYDAKTGLYERNHKTWENPAYYRIVREADDKGIFVQIVTEPHHDYYVNCFYPKK